jgi:hypothetical protein
MPRNMPQGTFRSETSFMSEGAVRDSGEEG